MSKISEAWSGTRNFFTEVQVELKKCTWPTRPELFESTVVVVVAVAILAVAVGISDAVLSLVMRLFVR